MRKGTYMKRKYFSTTGPSKLFTANLLYLVFLKWFYFDILVDLQKTFKNM